MLQASLVEPVAKLDIKDLLKPNSSRPPSRPTQPPSFPKSISVPSSCSQCNAVPSPSPTSTASLYSASTAPPNSVPHHQRQQSRDQPSQSIQLSSTAQAVFQQNSTLDPAAEITSSNKRPLSLDNRPADSPAKRQSKWGSAEDAKIIRLRGKGMKWEDISKELLGRSAIACRLHYQNYLERRSDWDEEKRNRLARVYERLKAELWTPIGQELGVPWRAAEAMHWALGETDMARRANVIPFSIAAARTEPHEPGSGRIAQRDRMIESTRVFEGRDLSTLTSPFNSVNSHGNGHFGAPAPYGVPSTAHVHLAPIKCEENFDGDEHGDDKDSDEMEGVRRRVVGGEMRLPGFAELDGELQAFAGRERSARVKEEQEQKVKEEGRGASG